MKPLLEENQANMQSDPQEQPERRQAIWSGKDVLLISGGIILIFALVILAFRIGIRLTHSGEIQQVRNTILVSAALGLLEGVVLIGSVYFLGIRRRSLNWSAAGLRPPTQGWLLSGIVLGVLVIPLAGAVAGAIQIALGRPLENPQIPFLAPEGFSWFGAISMLLLGGILAPFAEELFFRGVLYQWIRDRWGVWPGILGSALVFGVVHGDVAVGGAAAVLGVILAWAFERSQSLWPPVLIHVINNSVKIVILYAMLASGSLPPGG